MTEDMLVRTHHGLFDLQHTNSCVRRHLLIDAVTEVTKDAPESMMFADDIALCGRKGADMTLNDRVPGDLEGRTGRKTNNGQLTKNPVHGL